MATVPFQSDIKIEMPSDTQARCTISLSETGDIQFVEGREKLVTQALRAIVNDDTVVQGVINSKGISTRLTNALITTILREFKQTQIDEVRRSDPKLSGYKIYRKASELDESYAAVSQDPIIWKYVDKNLENGTSYDYSITKIQNDLFESSLLEKLTITPTKFINQQKVIVGNYMVAIPGDQQVTFYVDFRKRYKASELLDKVISINAEEDTTNPRQYTLYIVLKDLLGNQASLAANRITIR